jgi:hypothetical protein
MFFFSALFVPIVERILRLKNARLVDKKSTIYFINQSSFSGVPDEDNVSIPQA